MDKFKLDPNLITACNKCSSLKDMSSKEFQVNFSNKITDSILEFLCPSRTARYYECFNTRLSVENGCMASESMLQSNVSELWMYLKSVEEDLDRKLIGSTGLNEQMQLLHDYNDMKDVTQSVFGRLATMLDVTVSEVHKKFDLYDVKT